MEPCLMPETQPACLMCPTAMQPCPKPKQEVCRRTVGSLGTYLGPCDNIACKHRLGLLLEKHGTSRWTVYLGSSMMFRVWMARGDRQKMGNPAPSHAKSTRVPKG